MTRPVQLVAGVVLALAMASLGFVQTLAHAQGVQPAPAPAPTAAAPTSAVTDLAQALDQARQAFASGQYDLAERALAQATAIVDRVHAAALLQSAGVGSFTAAVDVVPGAGNAVQPQRVGGRVAMPTLMRKVSPVYPVDAKAAGTQGTVFIEAVIDTAGNVAGARVTRSATSLLDAAALDAVQQWKYSPTLLDGQPIPVILTVTINFSLEAPGASR